MKDLCDRVCGWSGHVACASSCPYSDALGAALERGMDANPSCSCSPCIGARRMTQVVGSPSDKSQRAVLCTCARLDADNGFVTTAELRATPSSQAATSTRERSM